MVAAGAMMSDKSKKRKHEWVTYHGARFRVCFVCRKTVQKGFNDRSECPGKAAA